MKFIIMNCILFCFLSCGNHGGKEYEQGLLCKCVIFPTGTCRETYQINLYEDGSIYAFYGTRRDDFSTYIERKIKMDGIILKKIEAKKIGSVKTDALEDIKKCLIKVGAKNCFHPEAMRWKDSWCVLIETNKYIYLHEYVDFDNNEIEHVYEQLIKFSPIPVRIHGWA